MKGVFSISNFSLNVQYLKSRESRRGEKKGAKQSIYPCDQKSVFVEK